MFYKIVHQQTKSNRGFTLIELLVVLVIIGIIVTVAVLAMAGFGGTRKIKNGAHEFVNLVSIAEEQAILEPSVFGLKIDQQGYRFYRYVLTKKHTNQWQLITKDPLFQSRNWPSGTTLRLQITGFAPLPLSGPQIIITPSGDITPFVIQLGNKTKLLYRIQAESNGTIKIGNRIKSNKL